MSDKNNTLKVNGTITINFDGNSVSMDLEQAKQLLEKLKTIFEPQVITWTWPSTGTELPKYNNWDITCKGTSTL